jgi:ABC-type transport system involved in multi-copper enzyme maturation permease subunit
MNRLIKIDFRKYARNRTFWILSALYVVLVVFVFVVMESFLNHVMTNVGKSGPVAIPEFSLYSFPYVWHNLAFLAGFFKIFLALVVIIFITNEFNYKTIRQNIMSGMSRAEFLFSKVIFVFFIALAVSLVLFFSALLLGLFNTEHITAALVFSKMYFVPAYFLEVFTFLLLALLFAFLLQKQGLAIGLFALYYYVIEPVIAFRLPENVARFLPVKMITRLIDVPNSSLMKLFGVQFRETVSWMGVAGCLVYAVVFVAGVYMFFKNRDL